MWTIAFEATAGVSQSSLNAIRNVMTAATEYWSRYIDHSLANLDVRITIENLGDGTLATGGTDFYFDYSSGGLQYYEAATIYELQTGDDINGSDPDVVISIDRATLNAGEFYLGVRDLDDYNSRPPNGQYDLLTIMIHEIGHALGFVSFIPDADGTRTSFDVHVVQSGSYQFAGPTATSVFGGNIQLSGDDPSHTWGSYSDIMGPTIGTGEVSWLSDYLVAMFHDFGVPTRTPTSEDDVVWGFMDPIELHLGAGNDVFHGVRGRDVIYGEDGDDQFFAPEGNSTLYGGAGDDVFYGGVGYLTIYGGADDDLIALTSNGGDIDGGDGYDTIDFSGNFSGVERSFSTPGIYSAIINIEAVIGSSFDDIFTGGTTALAIAGGEGFDTVRYSYTSGGGVFVDLQNGVGANDIAEGDTYSSLEGAIGSSFNDTLLGADGVANKLEGGQGNDSLYGLSGNDTLLGGDGADRLDGGAGVDTVSYLGAYGAMTIRLWNGTGLGGEAAGDTFVSIENVIGSYGNDALIGADAVSNKLEGEAGNDHLYGLSGDDTLIGGYGADHLDGGSGADTASYSEAQSGVTVKLWNGTGSGGEASGDVLVSIENVIGSSFSDALVGSDGVGNRLEGGAGNDNLYGLSGNDTLLGGSGADKLDGGAGLDTASYEGSAGAVTVKLWNGTGSGNDAAGDTLVSIENVLGSSHSDALVGSDGVANKLEGGSGNDNLYGLSGNDTLLGGLGADMLQGGADADSLDGGDGIDTASYADAGAAVTVRLWNGTGAGDVAQGDVLSNIENLVGSAFGDGLLGADGVANRLEGGAGNDGLYGLSGDDTLIGGAGADKLDGGAGIDTASYADATGAVTVRLWNGKGSGNVAEGDTLTGVENLVGSSFNDALLGADGVANRLEGGAGNDNLYGLSGDDVFVFARGGDADRINDFIAGAGSEDRIELSGFGASFDSFAEVLAAASQAGADTVIDFGDGDTITLAGVSRATLHQDDFLFV